MVQWLRICPANTKDMGSIPGWGTKIPRAAEQKPSTATSEAWVPQLVLAEAQKIPFDIMKIPSAATKTQRSQINKTAG